MEIIMASIKIMKIEKAKEKSMATEEAKEMAMVKRMINNNSTNTKATGKVAFVFYNRCL